MTRGAPLRTVALMVIGLAACVRPWVPSTQPTAVLVLTITERLGETILKQEFIPSRPFRVPPRPSLPRIVLLFAEEGVTHAGSARNYNNPPIVFMLTENPFMGGATINDVPVSAPIEDFAGLRESLIRYVPVERAPCEAITAFFIDGIGDRPREPVLVTAQQGKNWGTVIVDPLQHTLRLEPVLRVAPRIIKAPVEAFVSVDVAAGGAEFVIVSVTRIEEGYRAFRIGNSERGTGWQILPNDGETRVYVIDDQPVLHSPCRTTRGFGGG